MNRNVPPAPAFGEPCPIEPSAETLSLLAVRRSSSPQTMRGPGPTEAELADLLRLAVRAPDHGKLAPWRFVILEGDGKRRFVEGLSGMAGRQDQPEKAQAVLAKISTPPLTVAVISAPQPGKIPVWEQELSAGAVCMNFLVACQAMGFAASWITDWYAFDAQALALLGVKDGERVAGFIHIGAVGETPLERVRPDLSTLVSRWAEASLPFGGRGALGRSRHSSRP